MVMTPEGYLPRIVDSRIEKMLHAFGGVEITGPKWCGKTWTALAHASSVTSLMDAASLEAALVDPALALMGTEPHLVDEWQEAPRVWDAARASIDANANRRGQLILTGSSAPKDLDEVHHSGAGRIARIQMRPMSLLEGGEVPGGVSLAGLFDGAFEPCRAAASVADVARWCCRGGWPSNLGIEDEYALETPAEYIRSIVEVSVPRLRKDPGRALRLMRALASNTAQAVTYETLARDSREEPAAARTTISSYLEMLENLYLIDDLDGWSPPMRSKTRLRVKPKRYFVDPSLPAALLGASPATLVLDTQTLGSLFETLCLRDLRTFLSALPGTANKVSYYRDENGLEVDFVIELADGRWGAFECKLSDAKADDVAAARLLRFREKLTGNPASQVRPPEFLGFLVGRGDLAYRREDGLLVIPMGALEP